jgi:eukaryotic-like serine/threonine-protein kinase
VGVAAEQDIYEHTKVQRLDPLLGEVFDRRFRIEVKLAAGGFGAIYRATHLKSSHQFALKILHPNLTTDPGVVARFRREGAALTLLRDPHTITAYELGETDGGTLYIVMELLHGESLYERYRATGPLPWQRVVAIARAVCSSLAEAHALGIVHRDLKPTNIHLEPRGNEHDFVKVLDFGIAKILQDSETDGESDLDSSELTQAGQMIGTLDYMSPEQMVGGLCTAPSDIYTLGIVMYEMIAGRKPYDDANSAAAALAAVLTTTPERLSAHAVVPANLDRVVMKCLERQYTDRFQTAVELAMALDEILPGVDEVVTRVATGAPPSVPRVSTDELELSRTLPGLSGALPRPPKSMLNLPKLGPVVPADSKTEPVLVRRLADPADLADAADSQTEPVIPKAAPLPRFTPLAMPMQPPKRASTPWIPPVLQPAPGTQMPPTPIEYDATLVGQPATERAPAARPKRSSTGPIVPGQGKSLREAYPTIHRPAPSAMRPPRSSFDDRPAPSMSSVMPFDMSRTAQRDAVVRRLALALGIAIALLAVLLVASRL